MTYLLTLAGQQQTARSLNYAKALAPQMFQRAGTQHFFHNIVITDADGAQVGSYGRDGWLDVEIVEPDDDRPFRLSPLTRYERLEGLADRGVDTWRDFNEEN